MPQEDQGRGWRLGERRGDRGCRSYASHGVGDIVAVESALEACGDEVVHLHEERTEVSLDAVGGAKEPRWHVTPTMRLYLPCVEA